jgi:predicted transcriptional regulator
MKTVNDWLRGTRACEIMTREVASVNTGNRVADAIQLFLRDHISGAPVVDDVGVCVGVLSTTDIVNFEEKRGKQAESAGTATQRPFDSWAWCEDWLCKFRKVDGDNQPMLEGPVSNYMTRDVVSVAEDTSLYAVLRMMVDAHVHRVLVLDSCRRPLGIVSTMDVLKAALRAGRCELATSGV